MINVKELIEDVIRDLANNQPLDSIVSKVQVISRFLKNDKFKKWIDCEFTKGYPKNIEVPSYRRLFILGVKATYVELYGFGSAVKYSNQQIPIENLGAERYRKIAEIVVKDSISIVQQAIHPGRNIHLAIGPHESCYIQEVLKGCQIMDMYKVVSNQQIQSIVDQTKATLIDFFLELDDELLNNEIDFNVMNKKEEIEQIVNKKIYTGIYIEGNAKISDSNIIGGNNNIQINTTDNRKLLNIVEQIEILAAKIDTDKIDIAETILNIKKALENKVTKPKLLKTAFNTIKGIVGAGEICDLAQKAIVLISKNI